VIFYYLVRDVVLGADCSYRPGRTYVDEVFRYSRDAQLRADQCNHFCGVPGVCYVVLPHDDNAPLPLDYFEPKKAPVYERVLVG